MLNRTEVEMKAAELNVDSTRLLSDCCAQEKNISLGLSVWF